MRASEEIENRNLSLCPQGADILPKNRFLMCVILGAILTFAGLLRTVMDYNAGFMATAGVIGPGHAALVIRWQTGDQPESAERNQKLKPIVNTCTWLVSIISTTILL
jgi:hypothetical protein